MKETKTEFIIIRVTKKEKENLRREGKNKTLSSIVRIKLGLDK